MLERSSQRASTARRNQMSTSTTALMTAEEFMQLPDEDGFRDELINGELIRMPSPGVPHARITVRLGAPLAQFVWDHGLGDVFQNGGFKLTSNPDTVLAPDISFVTKERLETEPDIERYWPGAPDLAVEVLSPSDRPSMVNKRLGIFFGRGVKQVWMVNPKKSAITIYRSPSDSITFSGSDELEADDILPGFRISLDRIFGPTPGTTK